MANKGNYKKALIKATQDLGVYDISFNQSLDILAEILTERERVYKEYVKDGRRPLVLIISDRGAENMRPNPLLKQWNELNNAALSYLSAVGLTPAGLKKINNGALADGASVSALDKILFDLEA